MENASGAKQKRELLKYKYLKLYNKLKFWSLIGCAIMNWKCNWKANIQRVSTIHFYDKAYTAAKTWAPYLTDARKIVFIIILAETNKQLNPNLHVGAKSVRVKNHAWYIGHKNLTLIFRDFLSFDKQFIKKR